ncbi:MAG TPA: ATP-binding protein [Thermodesulfobacteriota bacterium]|nr:ATP-binding protein [Thermodesulfobacteriota bacterium]
MTFNNKVGSKLIIIYLFSLCLALSAVMVVAQSIISQQVHRRHQKKLEALTQKVFFSLEKQKDQIRLLALAIANLGQMGTLVVNEDHQNIRNLVSSVFKESDLDVLFVLGQQGKELMRLQSNDFRKLGLGGSSLIKKAIVGNYRVRMNKWAHGIFISGSAPIFYEDKVIGQVFAGDLIDNIFLTDLAKETDSFMAVVNEGKVLASTFTQKEAAGEELEFSEDILQDIKAMMNQDLPVEVEGKTYTMKSMPLRDREGNILSYLVIGLSRADLNQTVTSLRWIILGVGGGGALLGILLMIILTSRMRRQISLLSAGTEKVTSGDLDETIAQISRDELGGLARSFNQMAQSLKERDLILKEEKDKILANVDYLSMMVHDIKAPIAGVRLMIETLLEENLSPEVKERLSGMGDSIEELLSHLYNVLTISKIEKGPFTLKMEPVDLNASVNYVQSQCQVLADRKGIQISEDLAQGLPTFEGDEFYLERLIYNLLINAIHWAPVGGWVKLITGMEEAEGNRRIYLEVIDNGPGIPSEQKDNLFKKFISQPEKGDLNGTHSGLGLFICRNIVQAHGGTLNETGKPGEGARFISAFPLAADPR